MRIFGKLDYFFDDVISGQDEHPHFKKIFTNQTSFSTKSTTLNPMVKSDLVTYGGGTERYLFFSVAKVFVKANPWFKCSTANRFRNQRKYSRGNVCTF